MSNNGLKFEIFVEQLLRDLGKIRVRRNVQYHLKSRFSKKIMKIVQIDVQFYDFFNKYIVECKYKERGNVNDDVVNKVKKNLGYLGLEKAIIATNQDFHLQAKRLAKKYGIKLYNNKKLQSLDEDRMSLTGALFQKVRGKTIEDKIAKINEKYSNNSIIQERYIK
jgi:hypothetical protein